jgi:hypothetical protein
MVKRRRRFKQTIAFKDRLMAFAQDLREEASSMVAGADRDDLLTRAGRADTAAHIDEWARSRGQLDAWPFAQRGLREGR